MKVLFSNSVGNIKFKSNDDNVIAFDDSVSQERREYIRDHYIYENMRYQSIYEKEPRLDSYPLQELLKFYLKKPKKIDGDKLSELPLYNVRNISDTYRYNPQIYRGSTLFDSDDDVIKAVKDTGIKTVIDVTGYGNDYKEKIEKFGLKYFNFDIERYITGGYFKRPIDPILQKNKLIDFIKIMQEEYVYIGCGCGTEKTDAAIFLNTLFNPNVKGYCGIDSPEAIDEIYDIADKIYHNMTEEDKESLGWTPEFENNFKENIDYYRNNVEYNKHLFI